MVEHPPASQPQPLLAPHSVAPAPVRVEAMAAEPLPSSQDAGPSSSDQVSAVSTHLGARGSKRRADEVVATPV